VVGIGDSSMKQWPIFRKMENGLGKKEEKNKKQRKMIPTIRNQKKKEGKKDVNKHQMKIN
jgi:hypothetical protein